MTQRLMLLDTASLYFRAFYGIPDTVRAPDGTPVNAVRGLLDFITRLVNDHAPSDLVACWDDDWRPHWRTDLIPSYKAHRVQTAHPSGVDVEETPELLVAQIPLIREVLDALGIPIVGQPHHEADDVIGSFAAQSAKPVDIITGDRDLFQLVDDTRGVQVLYTARGIGKLETVTDAVVRAKYGVAARQYVDFAVLRGDASDGLPGVAGIGEKTAASLLAEFGDLDAVIEAASDPDVAMSATMRSRITAAADYLSVAPTVVRVVLDLPVGGVDTGIRAPAQPGPIDELAETWGLGSAATRAVQALTAAA